MKVSFHSLNCFTESALTSKELDHCQLLRCRIYTFFDLPYVLFLELRQHLDNVFHFRLYGYKDWAVADRTVRPQSHEVVGEGIRGNAEVRSRFVLPFITQLLACGSNE
jgi:hypothetical protein